MGDAIENGIGEGGAETEGQLRGVLQPREIADLVIVFIFRGGRGPLCRLALLSGNVRLVRRSTACDSVGTIQYRLDLLDFPESCRADAPPEVRAVHFEDLLSSNRLI
jgi:hypothetical protein